MPDLPPTSSAPDPAPPTPERWWPDLLHLYVLNAFAVAQPLLDRLANNGTYLVEQRLSGTSLLLVCGLLLTVVPSLLALVELGISRVRPGWRRRVHLGLVVLFLMFLGGQIARWGVRGYALEMSGFLDLAQFAVMAAFGAGLGWLYWKQAWARHVVTLAAVGVLVFPVTFVSSPVVQQRLWPPPETASEVEVQKPTPIVMLIFDGLAGMTLLNEEHQIDAVRYPNFARLAGMSHWFRNATTVHPRTDHAIPAILSGRYPDDGTAPLLSNYEQNLFTLLYDSRQYDLTVFEPYTRLCPPELEIRQLSRGVAAEAWSTLSTLQYVYWKITLPKNVAGSCPAIPREWFGLPDTFQIDRRWKTGLIRYSWDLERNTQVQHFVDTLEAGERPHFWFAHIAVPHYPFRYFPSGTSYIGTLSAQHFPLGARGELGELWGPDELAVEHSWQRYLFQVGYVDRCLGQVLDRLAEQELLDDCLLVVTADHGYSFRAGMSRRDPSPATLPDLLPVPLFVKLPHQQGGQTTDRNVETIDILPTIAETLGLTLPEPVDGESVLSPSRARLRKTMVTYQGPIVVEGDFPQRYESAERMLARFGSGTSDRIWTVGPRLDLIGRAVTDFTVETTPGPEMHLMTGDLQFDPEADADYVPGLMEGVVVHETPSSPIVLAISNRGQIAAVTRTYTDPLIADHWCALLPEEQFQGAPSEIQVWQVIGENPLRLRPCPVRELP